MAWRAVDSLSIRSFLQLELHDPAPDHLTMWRTRRRIDLEMHAAVFTWILQRLADAGLMQGHTIGIDATTLEANATLRSIVWRETGESCEAFLTRLAQAWGITCVWPCGVLDRSLGRIVRLRPFHQRPPLGILHRHEPVDGGNT